MTAAASQVPAGWHPTSALGRAAALSALTAGAALFTGRPDLLVLTTPFLVHTAVAAVRRPARSPVPTSALGHASVREGEGTVVRVRLGGAEEAEHAVAAVDRNAFQHTRPVSGVVGAAVTGRDPVVVEVPVVSTRWGRRTAGDGLVAATGSWAGHRWGPHPLVPAVLTTLPLPGAFDSRAAGPHPIGLVGTHPARRPGQGSELAEIRPFRAGDRLRRIHWRQSARTGALHVTGTVAEEDSSVLLLLDSGVEVGRSGGIHGTASTLDVAVRAAGAVAEHYLHVGDRVGLRLLGAASRNAVPVSGGRRHLRRVLDTLARVEAGEHRDLDPARLRFRVPAGAVVLILSPLLSDRAVASTLALARSGISVVVVDTLPADVQRGAGESGEGRGGGERGDPRRQLAWRMRLVERDLVLGRVTRAGVPVVPWRGPGTLDVVLRGLARRARSPRAGSR